MLESLLEHEMAERETRRIERYRAESALSPDKRLSGFDFAAVPHVSKAQVRALAEGTEWLERGANVLLFGPPGVGKSHLACALGHALIDAGRRVLFTRCCDLVQRLQAAPAPAGSVACPPLSGRCLRPDALCLPQNHRTRNPQPPTPTTQAQTTTSPPPPAKIVVADRPEWCCAGSPSEAPGQGRCNR